MSRKTLVTFAAFALALSLSGCSEASQPSAIASTSVAVIDGEGNTAPVPDDASPKKSDTTGSPALTVTDIRVGEHAGYDRVVYEMGGEGTPGWRIQYVEQAIQDGSGKPVAVAGDGILQVLIDGSAYPFDSGVEPYVGPNPVPGTPSGSVTEVNGALVFEGVTQSFIGVSQSDRPFSVSTLSDPTRLVIDVAH